MEILTILVIIIAWCFIVIAPAAKLAYEDELNKSEIKRGTSIFPGIPVMPIFAIIIMYTCNYFFDPIGTYILLASHILFLLASLYSIIYWTIKLKNIHR